VSSILHQYPSNKNPKWGNTDKKKLQSTGLELKSYDSIFQWRAIPSFYDSNRLKTRALTDT